jgi:predicted 3-demethylubiquinone-9 3-methyltransferase (glyoxalase superfamily)
MQRITPCLWFDDQAEEAARFYLSIFKRSKLGQVTRYGEAGAKASGRPAGSVMTVTFEIDGQEFTEAISFMVTCDTQHEIDEMWRKLSDGGTEGPCGWLKDRYGLSWQIVVPGWDEMLRDPDPQKRERVMAAILEMSKPDIEKIERAYAEQ